MNKHRTAVRWFAGLLVTGSLLLGAAPAQADSGWNGTVSRSHYSAAKAADSGWNGT